ncbi:hypothetical protein KBC77_00945 [Candidatus Saccharibacteria bacterium]|nr:hypothetical protein [Candidatus Saccharibacteria bacterium]
MNQNELKRVDDESLWVADMTPIQGELTIGISNLAGSAGSSTPAFITLVPQVGSPVRTDKLVVSMFSHPSSLDPQTSMEAFDGGRRFSITDREKQASLARYILLLAARNR